MLYTCYAFLSGQALWSVHYYLYFTEEKTKAQRANKVLEAVLLRGGRRWILTWVLRTSKPTLFPICCFSVWKQIMNHASSDGFPGLECLSSHWSKPICWIPFVTNNNVKMVLVCKSVDWGGAASYGQGSHEAEHSSNSLSSLRKSYNRHLDGEKSKYSF